MTSDNGKGRRKSPLTSLIEEELDAQGSDYFKLGTVVNQVLTVVPVSMIPPNQWTRLRPFIEGQVRRVASKHEAGERVWVAIPNETGEKWWKRMSACLMTDLTLLVDYRDKQINALRGVRKSMSIILKMQFAAAEQGIVLTYGEALAQLEEG